MKLFFSKKVMLFFCLLFVSKVCFCANGPGVEHDWELIEPYEAKEKPPSLRKPPRLELDTKRILSFLYGDEKTRFFKFIDVQWDPKAGDRFFGKKPLEINLEKESLNFVPEVSFEKGDVAREKIGLYKSQAKISGFDKFVDAIKNIDFLVSINFGVDATVEHIKVLREKLEKEKVFKNIVRMNFRGCDLIRENFKEFIPEILKWKEFLKILDLSLNPSFTQSDLDLLSRLKKMQNLEGLHLKMCNLGQVDDVGGFVPRSSDLKVQSLINRFEKLERKTKKKERIASKKLTFLSNLSSLKVLDISHNNLRLRDISPVFGMGLKKLNVFSNRLGDSFAEEISKMWSLKSLNVGENEIKNRGAEKIFGMSSLESLNISGNKFTVSSMKNIEGMRRLKNLNISRNDLGVKSLTFISNIENLEVLNVVGCFVDKALWRLKGLKKLKRLVVSGDDVKAYGGLNKLKKELPEVDITILGEQD